MFTKQQKSLLAQNTQFLIEMIQTQTNTIFFAQQLDSSISNKDYIVHSFKFLLLDIAISFFPT